MPISKRVEKTDVRCWAETIVRRKRGGVEDPDWTAQIQSLKRREQFPLGTPNKAAAAAKERGVIRIEHTELPLLERLGALLAPLSTTPEVEVIERVHLDGRRVYLFINQTEIIARVPTPTGASRELITERMLEPGGVVELPPHGAALFN